MILPRPRCRKSATMMGTKMRHFSPLPNLSLEELVPKDNFYRRLDAMLDLSFVRELVRECYACSGRPSVDPVVFFRLQLVMFFEGIRSERELMEVGADRLSVRWFLGYDLNEPSQTTLASPASASAMVFGPSGASSSGSSSCAWRPDWCGARSSTSTLPRSRPMP